MATCQSTPSACALAQRDDLRTIVEIDRRRSSVGLHYASDITRASRVIGCLWLDPDAAEKLARDILQAVASWRADEAAIAWTTPHPCGGAA